MKVYQYRYTDQETFTEQIAALQGELERMPHTSALFHAFAECWCRKEMKTIRQIIRDAIPEAQLVGTASFGNVIDGLCTRGDIGLTAMIFEKPDSWAEVVCCPLLPGQVDESIDAFLRQAEKKENLKAVEAYIMADVPDVTRCCEVLGRLPEEVEVFGGKSRFDHDPAAPKFVINDEGELVDSSIALVMYGGSDLHVYTNMICGWNPLGRPMKVTKGYGDILCELDGRPAHEMYYKYLHIGNDENFFFNTLEFPFLFYKGDQSVIRISHACLDDGSMVLGASIPDHDYVRIAFGDSNAIMRSVLQGGQPFADFRPDAVLLHTCGCRRTYWGDEVSNRETLPFQALAPTSGFYTAGELLRTDGQVREHNSTMVIAALREGAAEDKPAVSFGMTAADIGQQESLITRLSTFVAAAIDELETANRDLERLSITDGLTGLLNRREMDRRIRQLAEEGTGLYLVMMDLDDFKAVNDSFGHQEGDHVLQVFADVLRDSLKDLEGQSEIGRWGGEEFMVLLQDVDEAKAMQVAERIRAGLAEHHFPQSGSHSVSVGVTGIHSDETADAALSRVDEALYEAKREGKNRVVTL